jgi:hypothetical protein
MIKANAVAAAEFLQWLDLRDRTLETLTQHDIDEWFASGPPGRIRARGLLTWASKQRWAQLRHCLHDTDLPLDVRVAGALTLLSGRPC